MTAPRSSWQRCDDCGSEYDARDSAPRCTNCGGLLAVEHVPPAQRGAHLRAHFDRLAITAPPGTASGVWRFGELVLPEGMTDAISHPEGDTPLLTRPALAAWSGVAGLLFKHEGHNPTGSFKDRGMTVGVTQAARIGARAVACASTGNTAASLAAYASQAGLPALAIIPDGQIAIGKLTQMLAYGARTLLIDGDFDACLRLAEAASAELGVYLLNSVNPFRVEGQKTVVFEILQQLAWQAPDWIALPAGNLGNTAAVGKAIAEAVRWGLIERAPRIIAVQAAGAAPFAAAFARGFDHIEAVAAHTVATAIKIGAPASYGRAVRAIRDTDGVVLAVSDAEILAAKAMIDRAGIGCEPASAASLAGVRALRMQGVVGSGDRVVAILTGHLLKDPGILQEMHQSDSPPLPGAANHPIRIDASVAAIRQVLAATDGG
ncbi:MAG TPA: threonine synthase [Gemmatimonadales bacterium]|jgi:threonine synthase|nr:threonine synthase [Gemmatimonadales bacterium]